jgi:hypothetical protein
MFQQIEFRREIMVDLEVSPRKRLERILIRLGERVSVDLLPYVVETLSGPVEAADLCFGDGSVSRCIPYAAFRFVDEDRME